MYYVIGSGPSAVAGASALIAAGRKVTVIDAGVQLDPERSTCRRLMAQREPDEWSEQEAAASHTHLRPDGSVGPKLVYGSDFAYNPSPDGIAVSYGNLDVRASFAEGGLSNVWGASILPFRQHDISDWPVAGPELSDAHRAILKMLPVAGKRDHLTELFPLFADHLHKSNNSSQFKRLMDALERNRVKLLDNGVIFGAARLAVRFNGNSATDSCNYCGHCLHGCPRDLIYSSRHTLAQLVASGKIRYVRSVIVDKIVEHDSGVSIYGTEEGQSRCFEGARVLLATGVFSSTAILLRSLNWYERTVEIADSQHFMFPMLQRVASPNIAHERLHTLAQTFIEILDESISPYTVHLQVYGFNDLLSDILKHKLGRLYNWVPTNALLGRFLLIKGYLHSVHSGRISATLRNRDGRDTLELREVVNPDTRVLVSRVLRKIRGLSSQIQAYPVNSLLQFTQVGSGFHCGGSFPMATNPKNGQSDTLGRPHGWRRTHVIDATVLPSIPATTITQTVMANAFRIASLAAMKDSQ